MGEVSQGENLDPRLEICIFPCYFFASAMPRAALILDPIQAGYGTNKHPIECGIDSYRLGQPNHGSSNQAFNDVCRPEPSANHPPRSTRHSKQYAMHPQSRSAMGQVGSESDPGLQVLGVVIGGLPMVINSVNSSKPHYQSSREMVKTLGELTDTLKRQHFLLRKDLESILNSQAGDLGEERVAEILHQPHAVYFAEPDVILAVERSLGDGKDVYVSTVRKCGEAVFDIAERLAGFPSTAGKGAKGAGRGRAWGKRQLITSASQRRDFDRLLERLDYTTVLLARLRVTIEPQREAGLTGKVARTASRPGSRGSNVNANASPSLDPHGNADVLSRAAERLYTAISTGFDNDCHSTHTAALFLPSGTELKKRSQENAAKQPVVFTVGFRMPSIIKGYYTVEATVISNRAR